MSFDFLEDDNDARDAYIGDFDVQLVDAEAMVESRSPPMARVPRHPRQARSSIWNFFIYDPHRVKSQCQLCHNWFAGKLPGNLSKHLFFMHKLAYDQHRKSVDEKSHHEHASSSTSYKIQEPHQQHRFNPMSTRSRTRVVAPKAPSSSSTSSSSHRSSQQKVIVIDAESSQLPSTSAAKSTAALNATNSTTTQQSTPGSHQHQSQSQQPAADREVKNESADLSDFIHAAESLPASLRGTVECQRLIQMCDNVTAGNDSFLPSVSGTPSIVKEELADYDNHSRGEDKELVGETGGGSNASSAPPQVPTTSSADFDTAEPFKLSDGHNVAKFMELAAEFHLNFTFMASGQQKPEFCLSSAARDHTIALCDLDNVVRVTDRIGDNDVQIQTWHKADLAQFMWALRGKCYELNGCQNKK